MARTGAHWSTRRRQLHTARRYNRERRSSAAALRRRVRRRYPM